MDIVDELKVAIQSGSCVLILGSGISAAISNNHPLTSWSGLLEDGIKFAANSGTPSDKEWEESTTTKLNGSTTANEFLIIGEELIKQLFANGGGELKRWLRESVGSLQIQDKSVANALDALGLPIVTTNYDFLFEKSTGRDSVTWRDNPGAQIALSRQSRDVIHLHGHWRDSDSIILTSSHYELMLADESMNTLRQSMAAITSMVYIGFGSGMSDPTFLQLRTWIQVAFPNQELHHYKLCTHSEFDAVAEELKGETIKPVPYGNSFSDLPAFLTGLTPAVNSIVPIARYSEIGRMGLQKLVQEKALLFSYLNIEDPQVNQLLIPPVLLPVPHEQYVRTPRNQTQAVARSDINAELQTPRLIIAGEENVGVTSALLWMNTQAAALHIDCIPITIDYKRIESGHRPLHKRIRQELRVLGLNLAADNALPKIILTLDNVNLAKPDRWSRVAEELSDPNIVWVAIGCHRGSEAEIIQAFTNEERDRFHILYMGRMSKSDVNSLAKLISPRHHARLTEKAINLVRSQHLPRTPFTFSMILGALLQGESLMAATSTTTLLDAYVDALLGRGSFEDDPRMGLDTFNRTYLLSKLAGLFVARQLGELHQDEVVKAIQELFNELDWPDSPVDVLKDLQSRRMLLLRGATVSFSQTSYLHLFAAKLAILDPTFLQKLTSEPLYYSPILSHYASLKRTDQNLLRELAPLIKPFLNDIIPPARAWSKLTDEDAAIAQRKSLEAEEQLQQEMENLPDEDDEFEPLDGQEDEDLAPFPLQPIEDLPPIPRLVTTLGLISNLLRDTEVVTDQELRREVLKDVLIGWAQLADRFEQEDNFAEMSHAAATRLAQDFKIPNKHLDKFVNEVVAVLPLALAMGGISATLSSQKLVRAVARGMVAGDLNNDIRTAVLGMYLLIDVAATGWTEPLEVLLDQYNNSSAVSLTIRRLILMAYMQDNLSADDEANSQKFLVNQMLSERYGTTRERAQNKGRVIESLTKFRLKRTKVRELSLTENDETI